LLYAAESSAQRGGGGGRGGGYNRGGYGGYGNFGNYGGNSGSGAYGFIAPGFGFYGSGSAPLYGSSSPYYLNYNGGYDSAYSPLYGSVPYYYSPGNVPNVSPSNNAYSPPTSNYQSNYPPDVFSTNRPSNNTASIDVQVPADAKLWFDGRPTSQTGTSRSFVSPPLEPGRTFTYEVKAMWIDASGRVLTQTRTVQIQANRSSFLSFVDQVR
jgi:uncharacterized protein (TIGR03000 family)